jgi:hypothetical protein
MVKELLVAFAEITFPFISGIVPTRPVFHAAAAADIKVRAKETLVA